MAKNLPKGRLMTEHEWRGIGVQQSRGWEHYGYHRPEPHILLFRRPLGTVSSSISFPASFHDYCTGSSYW